MNHRALLHRILPFACLLLLACPTVVEDSHDVVAQQVGEVWVFSYSEPPQMNNGALMTGEAAVVDGCLEVDGLAVVWYEHQLATVEEALEQLEQGETISLQVGGGGISLDEGASQEDFPEAVLEHCSPSGVWWAADGEVEVEVL